MWSDYHKEKSSTKDEKTPGPVAQAYNNPRYSGGQGKKFTNLKDQSGILSSVT